jgi:hypothetical protein
VATSTDTKYHKAVPPSNDWLAAPLLLARYGDPVDCLTAHLMLEAAEVLAGAKPANLLSIANRTHLCGRNLYTIWQTHRSEAVLRLGDLTCLTLKVSERHVLLLCYNHSNLEQHLSHAGIRTLLQKAGYDRTATLDDLLAELQQRVTHNADFPHEIGLFIGYPAKDVAAFMGLIKLPFFCQGPWRIYGNPVRSLALADCYRCCRQRMFTVLTEGNRNLLAVHTPGHPFFCHTFDNNHHIQTEANQ